MSLSHVLIIVGIPITVYLVAGEIRYRVRRRYYRVERAARSIGTFPRVLPGPAIDYMHERETL